MYAKTENYVTFFTNPQGKHTDKLFSGRVSKAIKVGEENGQNKYEFEAWNARFVGKAKEKAEKLADKARIRLTEWAARNPYNKEKKRSYPYLLVMDFEVPDAKLPDPASEPVAEYAELNDDDGELPF